jgi:hypothetical protein
MVLINEPASTPAPMWAVVRYLVSIGKPVASDAARALLCPLPLLDGQQDKTFDNAVATLAGLGLIKAAEGQLRLAEPITDLAVGDLTGFTVSLRRAVLSPERNAGLGADNSQVGPRDLVRALAWFLTQDPEVAGLGPNDVAQRQTGAFGDDGGRALVNDVRWNRFTYWGPGLGLVAHALISDGRGTRLVPDCTEAVRQTLAARWSDGRTRDATEVIDAILDQLPVLPGGRYSRELGLPAGEIVAPSLSFALLRGHDEGWLTLDRRADAPRAVLLTDPDARGAVQRVSEITVRGENAA